MAGRHKQDKPDVAAVIASSTQTPHVPAPTDTPPLSDPANPESGELQEAAPSIAKPAVDETDSECRAENVLKAVTPSEPARKGKSGAVVAGAFAGGLVGLVAGVGAPYLDKTLGLARPADPEIASLVGKFTALDQKMAASEAVNASVKGVDARLAQLEKTVPQIQSSMEGRLKTLEPELAAVKAQASALAQKMPAPSNAPVPNPAAPVVAEAAVKPDLAALLERLEKAEAAIAEGATRKPMLDPALAALPTRIDGVEQGIAGLEKKFTGLKQDVSVDSSPAILAVVALARRQFEAGQTLHQPLAALRGLGVADAGLSALQAYATTPVPSLAMLSDQIRDYTARFPKTPAAAKKDEGVVDRLLSSAGKLVEVRPSGSMKQIDSTGSEAPLRARLAAGDLAGITALIAALPVEQKDVLKPWLDAVTTRFQAISALQRLEGEAAAAIAAKAVKKN